MWHLTLIEHEHPLATAADVHHLKTLMEQMMAKIDDLQAAEASIKADLDQIKTHLVDQNAKLADLTAQLILLQQTTPPQVDLQPAIDAAQAILTEADEMVASFAPAPEPAPEPADPNAPPSSTDTSSTPADAGTSTDDTSGVIVTPAPDEHL